MTVTVEERLRRAAVQLDEAAAAGPAYVAEQPGRAGRGPWLLAAAAMVAAVVALAAVIVPDDGAEPQPPAVQQFAPGWSALPDAPLRGRFQHLAVSTGEGVLVWGGYADDDLHDGAYFDAKARHWTKVPAAPLDDHRGDAVGAWTGTEVVVVNGIDGQVKAAAYNPQTNAWRRLPDPPLANAANMMTRAVFMGGKVVVVNVSQEGEEGVRNEVALFDVPSSTWAIGEPPPASFGSGFDAVVVGEEVVVAGRRGMGGKGCGDGVVLAYEVPRGRWRSIDPGPLQAIVATVVVSTGREVFVAGGRCADLTDMRQAVLLDPVTGGWRQAAMAPVPVRGDDRYPEVWTGTAVAAFDDEGRVLLYDPAADTWSAGEPSPYGARLMETPWTWVAGSLTVFGGGLLTPEDAGQGCCDPAPVGLAYTPPA